MEIRHHYRARRRRVLVAVAATSLLACGPSLGLASAYDWPQFDGNAQPSGTTSNLTGVTCPASSTCAAVGDGDTVVTTANGGTTWTLRRSGTWTWLKGITCPSTTRCFAVGDGGTILVSADGGAIWQRQSSGVTSTLCSIACPTTSLCYVAGFGGVILQTGNGGTTRPSRERQKDGRETCFAIDAVAA